MLGSRLAEEVDGDGFARPNLASLGKGNRLHTMPTLQMGREEDCPVEEAGHLVAFRPVGPSSVLVEINRAAPLLLPIRCDVDDQVETAVPAFVRMEVVVDMTHVPVLRKVLVCAAAIVGFVVEEFRDTGDTRHRVEKGLALDQSVKLDIGRSQGANVAFRPFGIREIFFRSGKLRQKPVKKVFLEKIIDNNMFEWLCLLEILGVAVDLSQHIAAHDR